MAASTCARTLVCAAFLLIPTVIGAQAPVHPHYRKPAGCDQAGAPGQPLAPRLQDLGSHTLRVITKCPRARRSSLGH